MKSITKEDLNDFFPGRVNNQLASTKGLMVNDEVTSEYLTLLSLYYSYFEAYLNSIFHLDSLEQQLDANGFKEVVDSEKDVYQYLSSRKYFYVRNSIFIERLTMEDLTRLKNAKTSEEVFALVSETFRLVTSIDTDSLSDVMYGPESLTYAAPSDAVVLGLRFREEDDLEYENDDEWFKDYSRRREIVSKMVEILNQKCTELLNCDVKVIEYFEESVKKKIVSNEKTY